MSISLVLLSTYIFIQDGLIPGWFSVLFHPVYYTWWFYEKLVRRVIFILLARFTSLPELSFLTTLCALFPEGQGRWFQIEI